jgi:tetratricopeptide (TPR) repeat protein
VCGAEVIAPAKANGLASGSLGLPPEAANAFQRGLTLEQNGDLDGALAEYSKALAISPNCSEIYFNRGNSRRQLGDLPGAVADYSKAIDLQPRSADYYVNRAIIRLLQNDPAGAIGDFDQAIALRPDFDKPYCNRATARQALGDLPGAIADYKKAIEVNPGYAVAYMNRGLIHLLQGDDDAAQGDFDEALRLQPDLQPKLEAHLVLARQQRPQPRTKKAETQSWWQRALGWFQRKEPVSPPASRRQMPQPRGLPEPPTGYLWERAGQSGAAFLRPRGWYFTCVETESTWAYFITKQPIPPDAKPGSVQFETGFTINVLRQVPQVTGVSPSQYAQAYVAGVNQSPKHVAEGTWDCSEALGDSRYVALSVRFHEKHHPDPIRMHHWVIADDSSGKAYLVMFEAPIREWDKEWPIAEVVFERLALADELVRETPGLDYNERGVHKAQGGDLDGAIADFDKAIQINPHLVSAYANRGTARIDRGRDLEGAVGDFTKALELNPRLVPAYIGRGRCRFLAGDANAALSDFSAAIELDPSAAPAYHLRGAARFQQRDLDAAIADLSKAQELDPGLAENASALLADAYSSRSASRADRDLEGAIADASRAIELNPRHDSAYRNRSFARNRKGDFEGAIADATRAIELDPSRPDAHNNRGAARANKGDLEGAIADCTRAIELDPQFAEAYRNRGSARGAKGDLDGAIADLSRAIELNPRLITAYLNRGSILLYCGKDAEARTDFDQCLQIDPGVGPLLDRIIEDTKAKRKQPSG